MPRLAQPVRGRPHPVAGRSLRASCPSLTRCCLRFAILASLVSNAGSRGCGRPLPLGWTSARGCPCPRAGYGSERRQDAEAKRTCREPRPGGPRRTSDERAWADATYPGCHIFGHDRLKPVPHRAGHDSLSHIEGGLVVARLSTRLSSWWRFRRQTLCRGLPRRRRDSPQSRCWKRPRSGCPCRSNPE